MFPYNRLVVRRSWFLSGIDTSLFPRPRSSGDAETEDQRYSLRSKGKARQSNSEEGMQAEPVHGDELHYEEALLMPSRPFAGLVSFVVFSVFALFFTSRIVSRPHQDSIPSRGTVH